MFSSYMREYEKKNYFEFTIERRRIAVQTFSQSIPDLEPVECTVDWMGL